VSGQGLVYNFDNNQYGYYKADKAAATAEGKDEEEAEGVDVYLNLINGVINREKALKYDNGALQVRPYFFLFFSYFLSLKAVVNRGQRWAATEALFSISRCLGITPQAGKQH